MEIQFTTDGTTLTAAPVGRIDSTTAEEVQTAIQEKMKDGFDGLRIDMSQVPFISSKGIRVLLTFHRQLESKGKLVLVNCGAAIKEVLQLSALLNYLHLE